MGYVDEFNNGITTVESERMGLLETAEELSKKDECFKTDVNALIKSVDELVVKAVNSGGKRRKLLIGSRMTNCRNRKAISYHRKDGKNRK